MKETVLIAGYGTMGRHYARNFTEHFSDYNIVITDRDVAKCHAAMSDYPDASVYCIDPNNGRSMSETLKATDTIASVIEIENISGIVNATQTDSHLAVIESALSAKATNGSSHITRVLQEKPFGLFDGDDDKFDRICSQIESRNIRFSLNSVLMFSDIWAAVDGFLSQKSRVQILASECIYGKDRTQDTRPAHEGVFGTEGTHAIDILRGRGFLAQDIAFGKSSLTRGDISVDKDVVYDCTVGNKASEVETQSLQMSLRYDQNYRQVRHVIDCGKSEQVILILDFDKAKQDVMTIRNMQGKVLERHECASGTKLKNSISAVFDNQSAFEPYDIIQARRLREMLAGLKTNAIITQGGRANALIKPSPRIVKL